MKKYKEQNQKLKAEMQMKKYKDCASAGLDAKLPKIECFKNQFKNYEITIVISEFTSMCPKTGLPDFGTITIKYISDKLCVELKSLKSYILGYRNLGIFYENAVNRILADIVSACSPLQVEVVGDFTSRGGMKSMIKATYPKLCGGEPVRSPNK